MRNQKVGFDYSPSKVGCPVETTLDVIGGKWKGIILYHLIDGKKRFNEFRKLYPAITQRMLTLQLRELEKDGIVHREIYKEIPPKVEYSLTEFGRSLEPIILLMKDWGETHKNRIINARAMEKEEI
ncbi:MULTISPECIES: winged helix-turn-helix transcriptional regulator [Priestia]|jgi:DNA-binding HxlR family transcriptional regulator|uniref:Transcriptional regulator n=1 Tax=Priestia megaterium TaxID=1404 RepID=A0AAE5P1V4_PRIMG|nr:MULTISPECIES: helix-turn-helix domain-containing protein [Priestia]MBZ5478718.1 helix-turn-helix transcriptional regulator [Bacillus sp. T_4]MDP9576685.1 DNA-binding HxlR family transcriptional regulator [Bacillus sp. 1751]RFB26076.1 transcriptional regulator [Bacillus sp. ALD]RFB36643.1 transcriptional regulator [Bacillus sp. RC]ANF47465.1 ArsR family transcriptional regulator [Priestia megaterium]